MATPQDFRDAVRDALHHRRPLLHHLNADTSWLLQLPRPDTDSTPRRWYNILLDPWLSGSQSDVASWFSSQWHAHAPAVGSIAALEAHCRAVEDVTAELAAAAASDAAGASDVLDKQQKSPTIDGASFIDVIAVSHEFTDHCHKETLLQASSSVPVFAAPKAVPLIKGWKHFSTVLELPVPKSGDVDWHSTSMSPLPPWLGLARLIEAGNALYYHSAILISFALDPSAQTAAAAAEAVVYTPHGIQAAPLQQLTAAQPPITTLALLHGLHDIRLPRTQLNLGVHNGLAVQRLLGARYWIGTHDEVKHGGGLIWYLLRRRVGTLKQALAAEAAKAGSEPGDRQLVDDIAFLEVGNGHVKCLA